MEKLCITTNIQFIGNVDPYPYIKVWNEMKHNALQTACASGTPSRSCLSIWAGQEYHSEFMTFTAQKQYFLPFETGWSEMNNPLAQKDDFRPGSRDMKSQYESFNFHEPELPFMIWTCRVIFLVILALFGRWNICYKWCNYYSRRFTKSCTHNYCF